MTFGDTLRNLIDRMMKNAVIVSPRFSDYRVHDIIPVQDFGVDEHFRIEVVRIIQEEIKIQMTEFRAGQEEPKVSAPEGSATTKMQGEITQALSIIKNPGGFVAKGLKVLPPAAAALFAIEIAKYVFSEITKPGGKMDTRWKRQMQDESNAFLSRQDQRNVQIGTRQVVIQSAKGFIQMNGAANENTLRQIRDGGVDGNRLARVDMTDHAKGMF